MRTCRLCKGLTELDDVVLSLATGDCVCLRCFGRATGSALHVSRPLRRALEHALADGTKESQQPAAPPSGAVARPPAPAIGTDVKWLPDPPSAWWGPMEGNI